MNLKFLEDVNQTIKVMRNGFYYLGLLAGIHTVTFVAYLTYRYLNDSKPQSKQPELPPPLVENPIIEMQEINALSDNLSDINKRQEYKIVLEEKRDELSGLILQLDTIYNNIGQIRERLENLNNKNN